MNQKRAEAGLPALAWSDSLASTACERAEEIVSDYSHNGARNCTGEMITATSSGSASTWYSRFANEAAHNANMMSDAHTKAAAAYCKSGNTYYVVVLFSI